MCVEESDRYLSDSSPIRVQREEFCSRAFRVLPGMLFQDGL
jgi:hypothetical protein